jgi:hypothetical protein
VVVWVAHLFPDISIITRVNHMLARQLLAWWVERVLKTSVSAPWKKATPQAVGHRQGAVDRAGVPRDNPEFALIGVCPPWPAITTGGCRELHLPGVLFYNMYSHLRQLEAMLEVLVWPGIDKVQLQHITTLGVCPEQLPPPSAAPQPQPGLRLPLAFQDEFFNLTPEQLSFEGVKAQTARLNLTSRAIVFLYIRADLDRAARLLALWEEKPFVAAYLLGTDRIKMVVWDLRELLQSVGRLRNRPPDWIDPFNFGRFMEAKRCRMETFLQEQLRVAAASARDTAERQARLQQGLAALLDPSPETVRASFVPTLMSLGPLEPLPPGTARSS